MSLIEFLLVKWPIRHIHTPSKIKYKFYDKFSYYIYSCSLKKDNHLKLVWVLKKIIDNLKPKGNKDNITIKDLKLNGHLNQHNLSYRDIFK